MPLFWVTIKDIWIMKQIVESNFRKSKQLKQLFYINPLVHGSICIWYLAIKEWIKGEIIVTLNDKEFSKLKLVSSLCLHVGVRAFALSDRHIGFIARSLEIFSVGRVSWCLEDELPLGFRPRFAVTATRLGKSSIRSRGRCLHTWLLTCAAHTCHGGGGYRHTGRATGYYCQLPASPLLKLFCCKLTHLFDNKNN